MARSILTIVMTYDISRSKTRRKVSKILEGSMVRVQKSVFEARLAAHAANRIFDIAEALLDGGDSLRMYVMSRTGLSKSRVAGGAPLPEEGSFWIL